MALTDFLRPPTSPAPASGRPPGITCADYVGGPAGRCSEYIEGGTCARPDRFICEEWARMNPLEAPPAEATAVRPTHRDRTGDLLPGRSALAPARPPAPAPALTVPSPAPELTADPLRGLTSADIDAFKSLGLEVRLQHDALGELFLVPETTGQPRHELTPEQAATVLRVMSLFPGARIVELRPAPTRAPRAPEPSPMSE